MRMKRLGLVFFLSCLMGVLLFSNSDVGFAQSNYDFIEVDLKNGEQKRVSFDEVMYEGIPTTLDAQEPSKINGRTIGIIGEDDRKLVENPTAFPYSPISTIFSYANASGSGQFGQGSGALIGSDTVLTCAHAVWNGENGFSKHVKVTPARTGWYNLPFGESTVRKMYVMASYIDSPGNVDWDIAVLKLDKPLGNQTGWLGVNYLDNQSDIYTLTGYPGEFGLNMYTNSKLVPDRVAGEIAWKKETVSTVFDATAGNSGSPIYDSQKRVNAVMSTVYGTPDWSETICTKGSRISKEKFAMINQFVNEPGPVLPEGISILDKKEKKQVLYNKPQIFQAKITPDTADQSIMWSSSDPTIASVDDAGKVVAHKPGRTVITASSKENNLLKDSFTVVTDDHSGSYNEATEVTLGKEMIGFFDYDSNESRAMTGEYSGDKDIFSFVAPEDGEYMYYDFTNYGQTMTRYMWFYNTGESSYSDFGSMKSFKMKKDERLFIALEEFKLSFSSKPLMDIGGQYSFVIDKKENIKLGNLEIKDIHNKTVTNQTMNAQVGNNIQLKNEIIDTTILNPDYKNVYWKSNNESIASIDKTSGLITVKKTGNVTITAYNSYNFFWNYSNLEAKIQLEIK